MWYWVQTYTCVRMHKCIDHLHYAIHQILCRFALHARKEGGTLEQVLSLAHMCLFVSVCVRACLPVCCSCLIAFVIDLQFAACNKGWRHIAFDFSLPRQDKIEAKCGKHMWAVEPTPARGWSHFYCVVSLFGFEFVCSGRLLLTSQGGLENKKP